MAGALFALVELDQMGFALRLLKQLWPEDRIEAPGAMWVIGSDKHRELAEQLEAWVG